MSGRSFAWWSDRWVFAAADGEGDDHPEVDGNGRSLRVIEPEGLLADPPLRRHPAADTLIPSAGMPETALSIDVSADRVAAPTDPLSQPGAKRALRLGVVRACTYFVNPTPAHLDDAC